MSTKARVFSLLGAVTLISAVACADATTEPHAIGKRSLRDTTTLEGDSTLCRNGWQIQQGRIVCNDEM
jgi:hypothetical protein